MPSSARLKKVAKAATLLTLTLATPAFAQQSIHDGFFTTSDGAKLHYLEAGRGESILFVPGWMMSADIWELQINDLSKDYHVVALDPRSQGGSDITPQGNDPSRRSKDISELLNYLHIDSVVLVGWSLGAFDAMAYLRQFGPDKVNALVLVDSPLAAPSGAAPAQRSPFLLRFQNDREHTGPDYVWSLFKKPLPPGLYKKLAQAEARVPTDTALAILDNVRPGDAWEPSLQALRQISLLYIITPTYASQAQYLQQVDPQARIESFENCGHALFVDESKRFNALLRDFLRQNTLYPPGLPSSLRPRVVGLLPATPQPTTTVVSVLKLSPTPTPRPKPKLRPTPTTTPPVLPRPTAKIVLISNPSPTPTSRPVFKPRPTSTHIPHPTSTPIPTRIPLKAPPAPTFTPGSISATPAANLPYRRPKIFEEASGSPIHDGYFTTSDHVKLHYLEAGHGLTLVFIPGWLLPAEIWKLQLQALSANYHVVALDPRSQGLSDMTPQGDEPLRQARDIQELFDHLQVNSVVLVGWSHGAFHVLSYLSEFGTDRLYAVVLVDSSLGAASSMPAANTRQAKFLEQFKKDREGALRGFIWGLFKNPPPADFTRDLNQSALLTPPDIALSLMNNVFPGDSWQPSIQTLRQVPLLYAVTPKFAFQADYLSHLAPLSRVEIFENTGHALFVDDPDHFNNALRNFLRQATRYPAGIPTHTPKPAATAAPNGGMTNVGQMPARP